MSKDSSQPTLPGVESEPSSGAEDKPYLGRDTNPGHYFKAAVVHALVQGGYHPQCEVVIGYRCSYRQRHRVDVVVDAIVIECKWQHTAGTGKKKLLSDIIDLSHNLSDSNGRYRRAYIVLGGDKWGSDYEYLVRAEYLRRDVPYAINVTCLGWADFQVRAWKHAL